MLYFLSDLPRRTAVLALPAALLLGIAIPAAANVSFTAKKMTRTDVPRGEGQCDIRIRVDNEVEFALSGNRVETRTLAGRDPQDVGSECNFPLPRGVVNNLRWEVRDGRGRAELIDEPNRRNGMRAVFNVRDPQSGDGRYHVRIKWDLAGSSDSGGSGGGSWGSGSSSSNRPERPGRGSSSNAGSSNNGWGTGNQSGNQSGNQAGGWGSGNQGSGWGTGSGWGSTPPPASLASTGRGTVAWNGRDNLLVSRADVRVNGNRAMVRIDTTANRSVEFQGVIRNSSAGFYEVDLDNSSEGAVVGVMRVDYTNNNRLDRIDLNGNAGRDRIRIDFRR
ncbi:MAG: hypothetical protein KIT83_08385 [Bryobacterales bacterium]|nr:hypothetical protein [Bryobacterales bacterium]